MTDKRLYRCLRCVPQGGVSDFRLQTLGGGEQDNRKWPPGTKWDAKQRSSSEAEIWTGQKLPAFPAAFDPVGPPGWKLVRLGTP